MTSAKSYQYILLVQMFSPPFSEAKGHFALMPAEASVCVSIPDRQLKQTLDSLRASVSEAGKKGRERSLEVKMTLHRNIEKGELCVGEERELLVVPAFEVQDFPQLSKKLQCLSPLIFYQAAFNGFPFDMESSLGAFEMNYLDYEEDCIYNFMFDSFPDFCFIPKRQVPFTSDNVSSTDHDYADVLLTGNRDYHDL
ncbi:hypothetical protein STEG23_018519, partial [Scotinomys teguina]